MPSWPRLPRGQRSRAGPFPRVAPSPRLKQGFAGLQVGVGFSRVVFFFFPLFPPLIVFCGGAGFLLSVSEVCSSAEKD